MHIGAGGEGRSGGGEGAGGRSGGEGAEGERGGAGGNGGAGGVGGAEDFGYITMKFTLFTHPKAYCNIFIIPHVDN